MLLAGHVLQSVVLAALPGISSNCFLYLSQVFSILGYILGLSRDNGKENKWKLLLSIGVHKLGIISPTSAFGLGGASLKVLLCWTHAPTRGDQHPHCRVESWCVTRVHQPRPVTRLIVRTGLGMDGHLNR